MGKVDMIKTLKEREVKLEEVNIILPETTAHASIINGFDEEGEKKFLRLVEILKPKIVFHSDRMDLRVGGKRVRVDTEQAWFLYQGFPFLIRAIDE